jgi:HlyD family secretion protein
MIPRRRKIGVPLVALVVVGAIAWALVPRPVPVDLGRVTRGPLRVTVDEEGKTRVRERYVISAPLAGRLRRIPLRAGDSVRAGETAIATIDPTDPSLLDARARAEAEARVHTAQATRRRADPDLERARTAHEFAARELERAKRLFETEALSTRELDDFERKERLAAEELKSARFAAEIAGFELELAKAALLRTRPDVARETDELRIESPVDGRVLRLFEESENVVAPGTRLVELGDPSDLEVEIDVLSSDAVRIVPDAPVSFEHWGGDRPLAGHVRRVEPGGFTKISALGVEEQRVNVIVDLDDPPEARPTLGDGYRVDARIVVWEGADVLKVPAGALFRRGSAWTVFAVRKGRARLRSVEADHTNGVETEIRGGLEVGEEVVLHPSDRIEDGVAVTVRKLTAREGP